MRSSNNAPQLVDAEAQRGANNGSFPPDFQLLFVRHRNCNASAVNAMESLTVVTRISYDYWGESKKLAREPTINTTARGAVIHSVLSVLITMFLHRGVAAPGEPLEPPSFRNDRRPNSIGPA